MGDLVGAVAANRPTEGYTRSTMADLLPKHPPRPREPVRDLDPRDFPGCVAVPMTPDQLEDYEGRIEYWEARTATAIIVAEPTSTYHETPSRGLTFLMAHISMARGSKILALGSSDLVQFFESGKQEVLMQADEVFYLNKPWPSGKDIDVEVGPLPDVILEVDHTTDVRRRRLEVYANWGFPEVWVEVPSPSWLAPRSGRPPSLTIYVLRGSGYLKSASSRAFAGWTAAEIHRALNEERMSEETAATLQRVGRRMARATGAGPDADPFLGAYRAESRAQGLAQGLAQGRVEGRMDATRLLVRQALEARGVPVTPAIEDLLARLDSSADAAELMASAVRCRDADDFLRLLQAAVDAPGGSG